MILIMFEISLKAKYHLAEPQKSNMKSFIVTHGLWRDLLAWFYICRHIYAGFYI